MNLDALKALLGQDKVLAHPGDCWPYGTDNSRQHALPDAVVIASTQADVVNTLRFANTHQIPIIPRGRASNTVGGIVPINGGIVLSLERLQTLHPVDPINRIVRAEAGVLNEAVQAAAQEFGLMWAPDPTSMGYATIGGNIACNAGGPRAFKYGTTRESVLGLTAVTAIGEVIHTGALTHKQAAGYDLTGLLVGSEGTLAVVTEATLRLLPCPPHIDCQGYFFNDTTAMTAAVEHIMASSLVPHSIELMDATCLTLMRKQNQALPIPESAKGLLLIELSGRAAQVETEAQQLRDLLDSDQIRPSESLYSQDTVNVEALKGLRKGLSPALRQLSRHKVNEDVVVPVGQLSELIAGTYAIGERLNIPTVNFGHAVSGNIHVNFLADPLSETEGPKVKEAVNALFELVNELGGTLSGEHGIGLAKKPFLANAIDSTALEWMRQLKKTLDPNQILNPGKLLP